MADTFTADEVVRMAMDMEQTGKDFYEALAGACGDPDSSELFARLAKDETQHYGTFSRMREQLLRAGRTKPWSDQQADRARDMVRDQVLPSSSETRRVALSGQTKDAVALAVKIEKDAIDFYQGFADLMPAGSAAIVYRIVEEEKSHLHDLLEVSC